MKTKEFIEYLDKQVSENEPNLSNAAIELLEDIRNKVLGGLEPNSTAENLELRNRDEDLLKLADAAVDYMIYDGSCEFGTIGLDTKRPFGNSSTTVDIAEIVGIVSDYDDYYDLRDEDQDDVSNYCRELYVYLPEFLKLKWHEMRKLCQQDMNDPPITTSI